MMRLIGALLLLLSTATGLQAAPALTGQASVIDGDTLEIHGERIRLHGIDAPESRQTCERAGRAERCGQKAALWLQDQIGRQTVFCDLRDKDRYGRWIAVCSTTRLGDLNALMVENGHALAYRRYSSDYIDEENAARAAGAGIWGTRFMAPWDWRRAN